jgi:hypothetical protein
VQTNWNKKTGVKAGLVASIDPVFHSDESMQAEYVESRLMKLFAPEKVVAAE